MNLFCAQENACERGRTRTATVDKTATALYNKSNGT